jgi:hypothetical protein
MSGSFDKREKGFESKWAHDEELRFKVFARRNKLLGLWAAAEMGVTGPAADGYAKEVIAADFEKPATRTCSKKSAATSTAKGVALRPCSARKMEELLDVPSIRSRPSCRNRPLASGERFPFGGRIARRVVTPRRHFLCSSTIVRLAVVWNSAGHQTVDESTPVPLLAARPKSRTQSADAPYRSLQHFPDEPETTDAP